MNLLLLFLMAVRIQPQETAVPYRQPQLAAAYGQVAMTFGAGSNIYFAPSSDGGRSFAQPVKVADAGVLALGRHRGPRLTILKNSLLITAVVGEKVSAGAHAHGLPGDGNLTVWRSTDRGNTWARLGVINDSPTSAREGLHAIQSDSKGNLFAAWLDLRGQGTQLYGSRSTDGGVTWAKNTVIYASPEGTICQCCDPAVAIDTDGRVYVMWRNALDGSRDLYVTSSIDGAAFGQAKKLGEGTWKINACPMDGGGLVVDRGHVISAWRRDGEVFLAEAGKAERKVGVGKDVAVVKGKRGTYVAWTNKDGAAQLMAPNATEAVTLAANGAYVNLAALPDGSLVAAWEAHEFIESKRIE